jgi:hypothetical protein
VETVPTPVWPSWRETTAGAPCPICGADRVCAVDGDDPELVLCSRIESPIPAPEGGWVHVVVRRRRRQRDGR